MAARKLSHPLRSTPTGRVAQVKVKPAKETVGKQAATRQRSIAKLLKAGEAIFAKRGFDGATTSEIAAKAKVPKATLHYYFKTKEDLYTAVIHRILGIWMMAADDVQTDADPAEALSRYIAKKLNYSRTSPELARLWAMELLGGARHIKPFLRSRAHHLMEEKRAVIRSWIAAGKMDPVDPDHMFFLIWAATERYAASSAEMELVLKKTRLNDEVFEEGVRTTTQIILKGLGIADRRLETANRRAG
jgi:TetR/AcrR family transcriptional regulator